MMRDIRLAWLAVFLFATSLSGQRAFNSGDYTVYSWTSNDRLAQRVMQYAQGYDSLPGLPADAPAFGSPIRIYLASDDKQFRELTGNRAPDWGSGIAVPDQGVIVLRAYGGNQGAFAELPSLLRHELAHIALHRYIAPGRIPRWFNEGYAVWAAGELDSSAEWQLRLAFVTDNAPPLDSLELSWPAMTADARVAYLLAASVVKYLVNQSGQRGLDLFLQRWHESHNFEGSLASTYGLSVDQLELHWKRDVRRRYGWLAALTQGTVALFIMSAGVLVLYLIRRRRDRKKLAYLRATELPDEPAYWAENYQNPDEEMPQVIDPEQRPPNIEDHGQKND